MADWMQTSSGKKFNLDDPTFDVWDIANALSHQCRYGGHLKKGVQHYSVAEHCVILSQFALRRNLNREAWNLLMHDASEAYLVDIPRPIKKQMPEYHRMEDKLQIALAEYFDFDYPFSDVVNSLDLNICMDEKRAIMEPGLDWSFPEGMNEMGVEISCLSPRDARYLWLRMFSMLSPKIKYLGDV